MIQWQALEYRYHRKSLDWFAGVIGLAVILLIIALWQRNFLFAIFIVIAGILVVVWARERPRPILFTLDKKGLWIGRRLHDYRRFDGFALSETQLQLRYKRYLRPYLTVHLPRGRPGKKIKAIQEQLLAFLPEIEYNESLIEALADWVGF